MREGVRHTRTFLIHTLAGKEAGLPATPRTIVLIEDDAEIRALVDTVLDARLSVVVADA